MYRMIFVLILVIVTGKYVESMGKSQEAKCAATLERREVERQNREVINST